jgi:hypothetical protein
VHSSGSPKDTNSTPTRKGPPTRPVSTTTSSVRQHGHVASSSHLYAGSKWIHVFRSPAEFFLHFQWLLADMPLDENERPDCACKYCSDVKQTEISTVRSPSSRKPASTHTGTRCTLTIRSARIPLLPLLLSRRQRRSRSVPPLRRRTASRPRSSARRSQSRSISPFSSRTTRSWPVRLRRKRSARCSRCCLATQSRSLTVVRLNFLSYNYEPWPHLNLR